MSEDIESKDRYVLQTGRGWEVSHVPSAAFRSESAAKAVLSLDAAEVWSASISVSTLAKGDRLLEHLCRLKLINNLPLTSSEKDYLTRVRSSSKADKL